MSWKKGDHNKKWFFVIFLLCGMLVWPALSYSWSGKVTGAESGDTFKVRRGKRTVFIRFYGVDAPEKDQPMAEQARRYAIMLLRGKEIMVETIDTDAKGREICLVWAGSTITVNGALVERGYAWIDDSQCRRPICSDWRPLQEAAQQARIGIWKEEKPVPPWIYRAKAP